MSDGDVIVLQGLKIGAYAGEIWNVQLFEKLTIRIEVKIILILSYRPIYLSHVQLVKI